MTTLPLTTLPQLSERGRVIVTLMQDCIAANWNADEIMPFVEKAADLVLGPSLAITPEVARALDLALSRTLNETAATRQTQGEGEGSRLEPAVQTAQTPSSADGAGSDGLAVRKPTPETGLSDLTLGNETRLPHDEPDPVAQRIERRSSKPKVAGPTPAGVTKTQPKASVFPKPSAHDKQIPTATEAPHQDDIQKGDGGAAKVSIASTGVSPPQPEKIEITHAQRNVLEILARFCPKGRGSPSITQLHHKSGEPSVSYQLEGLYKAGCVRNEGEKGAPVYVIVVRHDDPRIALRQSRSEELVEQHIRTKGVTRCPPAVAIAPGAGVHVSQETRQAHAKHVEEIADARKQHGWKGRPRASGGKGTGL